MKHIFLSLALLAASGVSAYAQLTVVTLHHSGITTPYYSNNGFVDAYNTSVAGDTITLPGGNFNPPASIDKRLTVIGTGHYPDSTTATNISFITGTITLSDNADSSCIEGLYINGNINFASDQAVNYVLIKKNYVNGSISFSGSRVTPCMHARIINNVIAGSLYANNTNALDFSNNIINGEFQRAENTVIQNNIFVWAVGHPWECNDVFYYCDQSLIQNNIIMYSSSIFCGGAVNNTVSNNLFTHTPSLGSGVISGNYFNVDPTTIFVNQTGTAFNYAHNYHLQVPGTYLGTEGTQIGIYGGYYPYKEGAVPGNPHIQTKTIAPTTTPAGDLNINIKVKAQND